MNVRVKICGITHLEDALAAIHAGADALGFMFFEKSPRYLNPPEAASIISKLPPFVSRVGVFVNPSRELVENAISAGVDTLQFHGEESLEFCEEFKKQANVIKAFRLKDASSLDACVKYPGYAWLLDSYSAGQHGGTGKQFNWDLAEEARRQNPWIILAGGLSVDNIADAVKKVRPYGVDVSSGVESAPGKKNAELMRKFVGLVRSC